MFSKVISGSLKGVDGYKVTVEVDVARGLPALNIVGLPDQSVKESKNRIVAALRNSGFNYPAKKITINLAPADIKKEGSLFDLPGAIGILQAQGKIKKDKLKDYCIIGELALDGSVRSVKGVLSIVLEVKRLKLKGVLLPEGNKTEAGIVEGIEAIPVRNINEAAGFLNGELLIEPYRAGGDLFKPSENVLYDIADVKGQSFAKRAVEVACAGAHNVIMVGPPGTGKTMLAKRIPYILPEMRFEEALETTKIHSAYGLINRENGFIVHRPFRSPHHTASEAAIVGGGSNPRPGEASLAHNGVLFLDELPEFNRRALEVLRQPLEEGEIVVSRARQTLSFPANFMLVCAMNPCPCGFSGHPFKKCRCGEHIIRKYNSKVSGPFLDRIDIHIELPTVKLSDLTRETSGCEDTNAVRKRVADARKVQAERFAGENVYTNSRMSSKQIKKYCVMDEGAKAMLKQAVEKLGFSARAYDKIQKVARTIADMDNSELIRDRHIAEAVQYRCLDRRQ